MPRWHAIVFDLDDTLYLERDYVHSGFRAVALWAEAQLGIEAEQGYATLRRLFSEEIRGTTFNAWLDAYSLLDEDLVKQMVTVYRGHTPNIKPLPDAATLLATLADRTRLGLVSDGYLEVQQRKLEALGLGHYFDAVVFSDTWGREAWKPSVIPFKAVLDQLGELEPRSAIYIADNPKKDFLGPRQLGMASVRVRYPAGLYSDVEPPSPAYAADVEITSLSELSDALDTLSRIQRIPL